MYSAKEKLMHFHKLVSPTVVEADLAQLHEKAPHLTDFTRFDLSPEKNHEEILFLLLDHCEHDEIVRNRREYASQAADKDNDKNKVNNPSEDGKENPETLNCNGGESPAANGGEGDKDNNNDKNNANNSSEDGNENPETLNSNGDESPDANGGEGDENPSEGEGGDDSSEEGSKDNEPTEQSSEELTAPSEDKDDASSKQEKAEDTPKKKKMSIQE